MNSPYTSIEMAIVIALYQTIKPVCLSVYIGHDTTHPTARHLLNSNHII